MQVLTVLPMIVVRAADSVPKDEDVKAGWLAFAIFIALILAVAFLGFSLVKQLRKAQAAKEAGVYGPVDEADGDVDGGADGEPTGDRPADGTTRDGEDAQA